MRQENKPQSVDMSFQKPGLQKEEKRKKVMSRENTGFVRGILCCFMIRKLDWAWRLIPVIPITWEVEIRRTQV
jgi:hypothetical protein